MEFIARSTPVVLNEYLESRAALLRKAGPTCKYYIVALLNTPFN